jgi:hypothetical protein
MNSHDYAAPRIEVIGSLSELTQLNSGDPGGPSVVLPDN